MLAGELLMATPLRNQRSRLSFPRGLKETVEKQKSHVVSLAKTHMMLVTCACKQKQLDAMVVQSGVGMCA